MSYSIQEFKSELFDIRVLIDNRTGKEWFGLKEICDICEINHHRDVKARLDEDDIMMLNMKELSGVDSIHGSTKYPRDKTFINEYGLYVVILGARDTTVTKPFKRWVTHEVLPSIRKTGEYKTESEFDDHPMMKNALQLIEITKKHLELEKVQKEHNTRINELEVKTEAVMGTTDYFTVVAYANLNDVKITSGIAQSIGKSCSKVTKDLEIPKDFVNNKTYGKIGAYHKIVLNKVFKNYCLV